VQGVRRWLWRKSSTTGPELGCFNPVVLTVLQTSIKYTRDEVLGPERHRPVDQGGVAEKKRARIIFT